MMRSMVLVLDELPAASSQPARAMNDMDSGGVGNRPAPRKKSSDRDGDKAFDIWLQRGLHQLYDTVAKEPIPEELLRLIEQDRTDRTK